MKERERESETERLDGTFKRKKKKNFSGISIAIFKGKNISLITYLWLC
jgi:hypothetical protein